MPTVESRIDRLHAYSSLVCGSVCTSCNNGWMGQLEGEVRPFLLELISNEKDVRRLTDNEKLSVARWAAKTAYSWYFAFGPPPLVPSGHPRELFLDTTSLPRGVAVFASQIYPDCEYNHYFSSEWNVRVASGGIIPASIEQMQQGSYKLSFQINHLHLMVAYWCVPEWWFIPVPGLHNLLHLSSARVFWLPYDATYQTPAHHSQKWAHQILHFALGITESDFNETGGI